MKAQNFTIPENWRPNDEMSIKKWMEKLPVPYDLKKCMEADERHNDLKTLNGL